MTAPRRIDQVLPSLASRDAIGNHTLEVRRLLRELGFASDVYYGNATPDRLDDGRPLTRIDEHPPDGRWLLYQQSIGSPASDAFARRPETKLVDYHNITPAELLRPWEPAIAEEVRWGRAQLIDLAPLTHFAMADSAYNARELDDAGYRRTAVVPLLVDLDQFGGTPDPALARSLADARAAPGGSGPHMLFVGKVAPHKAEHDLVKALAVSARLYDQPARLTVVGSAISEAYRRALLELAGALGVADRLVLAGSVSHAELVAYYEDADVFTCASDHEGFCVPLVEAMVRGVPVVAHAAAAVPETVGRAGLLLPTKDPLTLAVAVHRVAADAELRATLAREAKARVEDLSLERNRQRFADALDQALRTPLAA